jgi:hypothetical protein
MCVTSTFASTRSAPSILVTGGRAKGRNKKQTAKAGTHIITARPAAQARERSFATRL